MAGANGVYTGGGATVVMDPVPLAYVKVCRQGSGVDRHILERAVRVAEYASEIAPYKTGALSQTIEVDQTRHENGRFGFGYDVYSYARYAYYVHEGTGPSPRWPDTRRVMKFWGATEEYVYRNYVMHPGTPAQPFLRDALVAMAG